MKKYNYLIMYIVIILILLTGCSSVHPWIEQRLEMLNEIIPSLDEEKLEMSQEVVQCFSQNDTQGLKALFCAKTQELSDIDEQIQAGFDFVGGNVVSFNEDDLLGSEGESIEYGKTTRLDRFWGIHDIMNAEGKVYEIYVNVNVIYEEDKDRVGVTQLKIVDSDGAEIEIGYSWPDYYTEGSQLSYKFIKALSENDMDNLRATLCNITLKTEDINAQIQAAFDFFEGQATFGKVGESEGHELYDGDYDYHTTVIEDELVESHEPIRTYLTVSNENIMTDADKIYTMEFYAYHLYTGYEDYEGISQIKIISDDGREIIIGEKLD